MAQATFRSILRALPRPVPRVSPTLTGGPKPISELAPAVTKPPASPTSELAPPVTRPRRASRNTRTTRSTAVSPFGAALARRRGRRGTL